MSSGMLVASFADPHRLLAAARRLQPAQYPLDAFTPFPVEGLFEALDQRTHPVRLWMGIAGFGLAGVLYLLQWYSAVHAYPFLVGGRPLHSWPVFVFVPFEVGVLAAGMAGFLALLRAAGLMRLHHPHFDLPGFATASGDRFLLTVREVFSQRERDTIRFHLEQCGAVAVHEVGR